MKKLILATLRTSLFVLPLLAFVFAPIAHAQTQTWRGACVGTAMSNGGTSVDATDVATIQGFQCLIGNVLSVAITGLGLIGFVMFIVGAFYYMLSGGNAKDTDKAKQTITYAIIGLVVALSAFIILNLISQFTGVTSILNFSIPGSNTNQGPGQGTAPGGE